MTAPVTSEDQDNVVSMQRQWEESEWFQRWLELNRERTAETEKN
jgi:hypothetical protein